MQIRTKIFHPLLTISLVAMSAVVMLVFLVLLLRITTVTFDLPFGFGISTLVSELDTP